MSRVKLACILIVMFILCVYSPVHAADWYKFANSSNGDKLYIDTSDILLDKTTVTFWAKIEKADAFKAAGVKTLIINYVIDSQELQATRKACVLYYEDGKVINETSLVKSKVERDTYLDSCAANAFTYLLSKDKWVSVPDMDISVNVDRIQHNNGRLYFWSTFTDTKLPNYILNKYDSSTNTISILSLLSNDLGLTRVEELSSPRLNKPIQPGSNYEKMVMTVQSYL